MLASVIAATRGDERASGQAVGWIEVLVTQVRAWPGSELACMASRWASTLDFVSKCAVRHTPSVQFRVLLVMPHRTRAESVIREIETVVGDKMTDVARETLTAAIALDLVVLADTARDAEARIVKIETQLRVIADALLAMDGSKNQNFAAALRAVKDNF
jgi:hypothetical protein